MVVAAFVAGAVLSATPGVADAQQPSVLPRNRAIAPRVRSVHARSQAIDGSERVLETAEKKTVTFAADVVFEFDKAELTPAAQTRVTGLAKELSALGPRRVSVSGHTDDKGDDAYNKDLSRRRAEAVRATLDAALDDGFTFDVEGLGETKPAVPNTNEDGTDNPENRAANRRVDISVPNR